ncbi:MAG: hypothetical protein GY763_01475 [Gammaproteobacteria bacterium]|nr:hypothetical protein [Gammaproteobacteria bacterium]
MTVESPTSETDSGNTVTVSSTSESQSGDNLLLQDRPNKLSQRRATWASPLSESTTYSLFSENTLLIDQD